MADVRRCRVSCTVVGTTVEFGRTFGVGQHVDLDDELMPGRTVRDEVPEDFFEPIDADGDEHAPAPRRRRGGDKVTHGD